MRPLLFSCLLIVVVAGVGAFSRPATLTTLSVPGTPLVSMGQLFQSH